MSATDELAAKLSAANTTQDAIDDHLRAVAFNATLEAMEVHGRNRLTVEDSRMANAIFRILSYAKPANIHKDDLGLVPSAQVTPNLTVAKTAAVTKLGDTMDALKQSIADTASIKSGPAIPQNGDGNAAMTSAGSPPPGAPNTSQIGEQAVAQALGELHTQQQSDAAPVAQAQ